MSKNNADNLRIVGIIFFTSKVHHPPTLNELPPRQTPSTEPLDRAPRQTPSTGIVYKSIFRWPL